MTAAIDGEDARRRFLRLRKQVMSVKRCPKSGRELTIRTAVHVIVTTDDEAGAMTLDGAAWDVIATRFTRLVVGEGATVDVIDGRTL